MTESNVPTGYERADNVRVDVTFPERWGDPEGDPGTPARRAWVIEHIREDGASESETGP